MSVYPNIYIYNRTCTKEKNTDKNTYKNKIKKTI